jgi:hypothetical protein
VADAFLKAMRADDLPSEVLTENGKQFTGRFTKPRPAGGAVRAGLPRERDHRPTHQAALAHHDRQDRALASNPANQKLAGHACRLGIPTGERR